MILVPSRKAVVFKLRDPGRILNVIPTARRLHVKGQEYVAVPHRMDETKVLRNLGFDVPAPIRHYYDWPGRFTPFAAQREAAAFLSMHSRAFNLSELGTGKSLASLWAYDYLRSVGVFNRVLIVSPLSTLERTWADEVFSHFPHLTYSVLYGAAARRKKLLAQEVDVYIVNHDGLEIIEKDLTTRPDIDLVVVDEVAQVARNSGTDRWRVLNRVVNKQGVRACWGMTGTPTPNGPEDAWAQCRLLVPNNVPPFFKRFQDMVSRQIGPYTRVPRDNAMDIVHDAMQPAIRFTRDECVDLPPLMYETRSVVLTTDQARAYKEMLTTMRAEADAGDILAVNEAVKMSKLVQICCGVSYGTNGEEVAIPATHRIQAVLDIVEEAEGKVIVFVPFVSALSHLAAAIGKHYQVEVIHGGVGKTERDRILSEFQRGKDLKVLVAQPATMSHGLTLTAASTIVWFAPVTSNEVFEQACGRIQRPGQQMNTFIIMLEGSPVERRIYSRLQNKQKMQGTLLEEIKATRGEVIA